MAELYGTPQQTSTPRSAPNTEQSRFVSSRRNRGQARRVSFNPSNIAMEALRKRLDEERRRKEVDRETERSRRIEEIASAVSDEEVQAFRDAMDAADEDEIVNVQRIAEGLSIEEAKNPEKRRELMLEGIRGKIAYRNHMQEEKDLNEEATRQRLHQEHEREEHNQRRAEQNNEEEPPINPESKGELETLSPEEREMCFLRGKKVMGSGHSQEEIQARKWEIMSIGWTLLKAEIEAMKIRDHLNSTLNRTAKDQIMGFHQRRSWADEEKSELSIELPKRSRVKKRKSIKELGQSFFGRKQPESDDESEADSPVIHKITGNVSQPTFPQAITLLQVQPITPFDKESTSNASQFLKSYEMMAASWTDRSKVLNLGQYLVGAAAAWRYLAETSCRNEVEQDKDGNLSNRWESLTWKEMK
jgi:hypothetical protein